MAYRDDGMTDPHKHTLAFTMVIKRNDLIKDKVKSVMVKKFKEFF